MRPLAHNARDLAMFEFRKLFAPRKPAATSALDPESDFGPGHLQRHPGLEEEYRALVEAQLNRCGIRGEAFTVQVRRMGRGPGGFDVLAALLRLHRWERGTALGLMLGLPLLEAQVRRAVRDSWLADCSHFAGLWLHAAEQLNEGSQLDEVRGLLRALLPQREVQAEKSAMPQKTDRGERPVEAGHEPKSGPWRRSIESGSG